MLFENRNTVHPANILPTVQKGRAQPHVNSVPTVKQTNRHSLTVCKLYELHFVIKFKFRGHTWIQQTSPNNIGFNNPDISTYMYHPDRQN